MCNIIFSLSKDKLWLFQALEMYTQLSTQSYMYIHVHNRIGICIPYLLKDTGNNFHITHLEHFAKR